ncbi:hypothetical protein FRC02_008620 [Tulasnella sp. 418]|nr:hypothetical protein FRC02_008620 [Tulasnella sp. 418]
MAVRQDSLAYDAVHAHSVELNDTGLNFIYIGLCEVNLYDIEVSYDGFRAFTGDSRTLDINSLYSIASHPVQMLHDEAMRIISKPSDYLNLKIIETLGPATFYDQGTPGFSDKLSAEFARQFLSLVSAFSAAMAPAITVTDYSAKLVSRYPLMRTLAYIGVVYAHGLFAIILYVGVVGRSSRTVVVDEVVEYVNWKGELVAVKQKPVQELLLVQSRLTDSLVIVAEHFLWLSADTAEKQGISTGALSAQRSAVEMFNVEDQDTVRVDIGLIKGQDGQRWYGLKHRKGDILLENTENIV